MAIYLPPNYLEPITIFNPANWETVDTATSGGSGVDIAYLDAHYLKFPSAQVDETFTQLDTTSDLNVYGNVITNTIHAHTASDTVSLYTTTTTGNIGIGTALATGTLRIGTTTNSNHIGNFDFTGVAVNNTTATTGDLNIGDTQTTGTLNIASNAARTGQITIGSGASNTGAINIGATNSVITIRGSAITINGVNQNTSNTITYTTLNVSTLADTIPSPYFVVLIAGVTVNNVFLPDIPYLGMKVVVLNYINTTSASLIRSNTPNIYPTGLTSSTNQINCIGGDCITMQYSGTNWYQLNKPNANIATNIISYASFAPTSFIQIGYYQDYAATQVASATVATFTFSQQVPAATLVAGMYYISLVNKIVAGTTAGNVLNAINTGLSTAGTVATELAYFNTNLFPSNTTMLANGTITSSCSGTYVYTGALLYNTTSYVITTVAGTGVVCTMNMRVMRLA